MLSAALRSLPWAFRTIGAEHIGAVVGRKRIVVITARVDGAFPATVVRATVPTHPVPVVALLANLEKTIAAHRSVDIEDT